VEGRGLYLVDDCVEGCLSSTLMIEEVVKGNESRVPGQLPMLPVSVTKSAARKAVAALSAVHEHSRRPESAAQSAPPSRACRIWTVSH
jgi:hypothetical protein